MTAPLPRKPEPGPQGPGHEPMPKSWRPVWIFMGLMALVVLVMGVAAAIIALLVRQATGG